VHFTIVTYWSCSSKERNDLQDYYNYLSFIMSGTGQYNSIGRILVPGHDSCIFLNEFKVNNCIHTCFILYFIFYWNQPTNKYLTNVNGYAIWRKNTVHYPQYYYEMLFHKFSPKKLPIFCIRFHSMVSNDRNVSIWIEKWHHNLFKDYISSQLFELIMMRKMFV